MLLFNYLLVDYPTLIKLNEIVSPLSPLIVVINYQNTI
jgi:hypothetical protein